MKRVLFLATLLLLTFATNAQVVSISTARTYSQGQSVEISGIVINGGSLGPIRYIQDATGGLPVYDPSVTNNWNIGDSITVAGVMGDFNGLIQIVNTTSDVVHSTGHTLPTPVVTTPNGLNASIEATLATVTGVSFANAGGTFANGTYSFSDQSGQSSVIYLRSGHPLVGSTIPLTPVNLTGVVSVFSGSYQLLPRDANDIVIGSAFYLTELPDQSNLTQTSFDVSWQTNAAGSTNLRYGTDPSNLNNVVNLGGSTTTHTVSLTGLTPATIYYIEAFSDDGSTTVTAPIRPMATVSNSTGQIDVYFNQVVDISVSSGTNAQYIDGAALEAKIIEKIDNANNTIDVAIYSINRTTIVTALNNAVNRGVQVRFVTNSGSNNTALQTVTPAFPHISGNGNALMHNKFIIFDVDSQDSSWLFTGSMNFTTGEIGDNYNNVLFIQDQTLARAYEVEFEEMWGDDGASPGIFSVLFGDTKTDNTPKEFIIGGVPMELYFSPSDGTTNAISNAIKSADSDVSVAMFSFTRNDLRDDLIAAHNSGANVRVMIENINDTGGEYQNLINAGISTKAHPETYLLHHKYAIIDEGMTSSDPIVVTGCHNWSTAAESSNDENTLIIHDATIANMYAQEFNARWLGMVTGTTVVPGIKGFEVGVFPNPVRDIMNLSIENENFNQVSITIYDMNGQLVHSEQLSGVQGATNHQINLSHLASGNYGIVFTVDGYHVGKRIQVVK